MNARSMRFAATLFCCLNLAAAEAQYWSNRIDLDNGNESAQSVWVLEDGLLVLAKGYCAENTTTCCGLLKFTFEGDLVWKTVFYDTLKTNHPEGVLIRDDTIFLHVNYHNVPGRYFSILAFDPNGQYLTRYDYGQSVETPWARDLSATADDGVYLAYQFRHPQTQQYLGRVSRLNPQWQTVWTHEFTLNDSANLGWCDTEPVSTGGCASAYTMAQNGYYKARVDRRSSDGTLIWTFTFPQEYYLASMIHLAAHPDGGFVGVWPIDTFGLFIYGTPALVFKLDSNGQMQWQKIHHTPLLQDYYGLTVAHNGDILVCGLDQNLNLDTNYYGAYLRRLNPSGQTLWEKRVFDYSANAYLNWFNYCAEMENGDLVLCGEIVDSSDAAEAHSDIWLLRLDSNACLIPECESNQVLAVSDSKKLWLSDEGPRFCLFPTLFDDQLTIGACLGYSPEPGRYNISISDASGRVWRRQPFEPNRIQCLDVRGLPEGTWFFLLFHDDKLIQTLSGLKQ